MKSTFNQIKQYFDYLINKGVEAFNLHDSELYQKNLRLAAKVIRDLSLNQQIDVALAIEPIWYNQLVKKVENEEHYCKAFQWHSAAMWKAGKMRSPGFIPPAFNKQKKIIFIAHTGFYLGHIAVMVQVMKDWRRIYPDLPIFFVALNGIDEKLSDQLRAIGVNILILPDGLSKPTQKIQWVREKNSEIGIDTAIWLSTPCWVSYVFGYGVAARQCLWSLKFHPVYLGDAVTHIGMTKGLAGYKYINENPWKEYQPPLAVDIREVSTSEVDKVKKLLPKGFLFGTLAREEKFNSDCFVKSVVEILKLCPDSYFLYTGKINSPHILEVLKGAGLESRAIYLGWVDTNLYAKILDVFLETYPFGCGVTGMQALSHGTKVISMWSDNTLPRFYFNDSIEAQAFSPNWSIANNTSDYINQAIFAYRENRTLEPVVTIKDKIQELDKLKSDKLYKLVYEN